MKKNNLSILMAVFSLVLVICTFANNAIAAYAAGSSVASPVASKKSGTYTVEESFKISLKTDTKNADIYYSVNGADYKKYSKKITISKNTTLDVYAVKNNVKSKTVTYVYKLKPTYELSAEPGVYDSSQVVYLSTALDKVSFYYTLDGSKPSSKSTKYTSKGIQIEKSSTLRIYASKKNWTTRMDTYSYEIEIADEDDIILLDDYHYKTLYNLLDDRQKAVYELIYNAFDEYKTDDENAKEPKVTIPLGDATIKNEEELRKIFDYCISENPQFFYVNDSYVGWTESGGKIIKINFNYTDSKKYAEKTAPVLRTTAEQIITDAFENAETHFDVIKYLHDYLTENIKYDIGVGRSNAGTDDAIISNTGLCVAYARAFCYLSQLSGYECIMVLGDAVNSNGKSDGHAWNKIKIEDDWYCIDVCWDDPTTADNSQMTLYDYFCVTDEQLNKNHFQLSIFDIKALKATATDMNYYDNMGITVYDNENSFYNYLIKNVSEAYLKNEAVTEYYYKDFDAIKIIKNHLDNQGLYNDIKNYINSNSLNITGCSYMCESGKIKRIIFTLKLK